MTHTSTIIYFQILCYIVRHFYSMLFRSVEAKTVQKLQKNGCLYPGVNVASISDKINVFFQSIIYRRQYQYQSLCDKPFFINQRRRKKWINSLFDWNVFLIFCFFFAGCSFFAYAFARCFSLLCFVDFTFSFNIYMAKKNGWIHSCTGNQKRQRFFSVFELVFI